MVLKRCYYSTAPLSGGPHQKNIHIGHLRKQLITFILFLTLSLDLSTTANAQCETKTKQ